MENRKGRAYYETLFCKKIIITLIGGAIIHTTPHFYHLYHPIINCETNQILGFEALLRSVNEPNPLIFFKNAREEGNLINYDLESIKLAYLKMKTETVKSFINVFPMTILSDQFINLLSQFKNKENIILEINETNDDSLIWNKPEFKSRLQSMRELNIQWALDDVGAGQSSLQRVLEFKPDYIKLDKYFSAGLSHSKQKQRVISFFVEFCREENIKFILEGIESRNDFLVAQQLKVPNIQGFYFGKPSSGMNLYLEVKNND
ncbi:EAL domain-containing protein (putative c-di-GMP-specific phosphodiesterase class I) [Salirhabdus euzebyi]|uniref:EAL domain-containing protein (Putative c-di-GMP-specific phosphodiesterase class I) n=1 Tax=Salirhabdus euzebyi TaxID=394506 RepID=A0A841Q959_9BACI|nr:EAL domain-containing protein [Salirhabdus euzebyi]MBB6454926.1 EAL domain-containing protein (putative c-di-GMP-specific phosphodiesterase class I) [Salirhabdus euzebyi]